MRISFDLDDTLICSDPAVPREPDPVPFWLRSWFAEPLRLGTVQLMNQLRQDGWEIFIYTTSYRSPQSVKRWFGFFGVPIAAVINQEMHDKIVGENGCERTVSKHPPTFDIDLHVDDLEGVRQEGKENNFDVVIVQTNDENWTDRVLEAAARKAEELQLRSSSWRLPWDEERFFPR